MVGRHTKTHISSTSNWIMLTCERVSNVITTVAGSSICKPCTLEDRVRGRAKPKSFYLSEMHVSLACLPEVSHIRVGSL